MSALFQKYINNNLTDTEFLSVIELFVKSENRKALESDMRIDWDLLAAKGDAPDLSGTLHRIHYEINKQEKPSKIRKLTTVLSRIAAILILPLAIAYLFQLQKNEKSDTIFRTISTPLASKTNFELPDGSKVWLNSGSSITFPENFNEGNRLVKLSGEAYFDVKKSEHPFQVKTEIFTVEVHGTAFNVMAYDHEIPAVTLERGSITLETISKQHEMLNPGQQAEIDTINHSIALKTVETNLYSSWINDQLIIKNEPLATVVKKLEHWYNIKIDVENEEILSKKITATIEFESLREVMDLMELTLPLKFTYDKDNRKLNIIGVKNNDYVTKK